MMECEHEEVEMNRVPVTKRNSTEEGNTAKKKMKTLSPPDDSHECLAAVESKCAVVCSVHASSDATDSHTVSNTETGGSVHQEQGPSLSKRQIKKEKKRELYRAGLALRRAREKEKRRQKKLEARLNSVDLGPSRKELKQSTMANSKCKMRVAIDMSFDHLMNEKDLGKCVKQLLRCYSANRRAQNPIQLYITSFKGKTKEAMAKHTGYQNWDVYFQPESYLNLFDHKDIVYLTSESENILQEMQDDKAYIIGGLVDHNSQKGVTLAIAEEKGLCHAQLPIENFLEMKTRKVLSIVHVFEIMLLVSEGMSWKDALLHVMPARKGAAEKSLAVSAIAECSSQEMEHTRNQMSDLQPSDEVPGPSEAT